MTTRARPYHHGNLRDALLDAAERSVDDLGVEQLSLRELARTVGVSHAAPRSHFPDRQALLDALGERGFARLGTQLRNAYKHSEPRFEPRLHALIASCVAFAARNPALLDLMFAIKPRSESPELQLAAAEALSVIPHLIEEGKTFGDLAPADTTRYVLLLSATIRGVVALVASDSIDPHAVDDLISDATSTFVRGSAPKRED